MPGLWKAEAKTQLPVLWRLAAAGQGPGRFALVGAAAVGVAGDHVGAVDSQPRCHLGRGLDAGDEDRRGGDVGC